MTATRLLLISSMAGALHAATLTGHVTGDVSHLPWRRGKEPLGWVSLRVWQGGRLVAVPRTQVGGAFRVETPDGECEVEATRPAFLPQRVTVTRDAVWNPRLEPDPDFGLIVEPRAGMSRFCLAGETVQIDCAAPASAREWQAALVTDYTRAPMELAAAEFGERMVWCGRRPGWRLSARTPKDLPPGLYGLALSYIDANGTRHSSEQPAAVSVLEREPTRFRLLMHTDWHFNWFVNRPGAAGQVQAPYFRAATLMNALWVSLGDDVGFEGDDHVAMFWHMLRHDAGTPVFLAFGNHDAKIGREGHEFYFGPPVQTRRVGSQVAIVRSFDLYQADWRMPEEQARDVVAALAAAGRAPNNKAVFLAGHRRRWKPRGDHFELPPLLRPHLRLRHVRGPRAVSFEKLLLDSFSVMSMHGWGGLAYTTRAVDVDLGAGRVRVSPEVILPAVRFSPANNGSSRQVTATLFARGATRPLEKYTGVAKGFTQPPTPDAMKAYDDLADLSLRFVMPRGRYVCDGGRIVRQWDAAAVTLVDVKASLSSERASVTVRPR